MEQSHPSKVAALMPLLTVAGLAVAATVQPGPTASQPIAPQVQRQPDAVVDTSSLGLMWVHRLDGLQLGVTRAQARPEGTAVIDQPGRIIMASGRWVFVPDRTEPSVSGTSPAPMADAPVLILPNRLLQSLTHASGQPNSDARFRVSGRLTLYRGINALHLADASPVFISPSSPPPKPMPTTPNTAVPQPSPSSPAGTADRTNDSNPDVQNLLDRLDRLPGMGGTPQPTASDAMLHSPTRGHAASNNPTPIAANPAPLAADSHAAHDGFRDGDLMSRRTGRLVRTPAGRWAFAIDQGVGTPAEPASNEPRDRMQSGRVFTIQPGVALQQLETVALQRGDRVRVELSGRVMTFEDSAYILPTVYRVLPASDLDPMG